MQIKTVVVLQPENIQEALRAYLSPHITIPEGASLEISELANGTFEVHVVSSLPSKKETTKAAPKTQKEAPKQTAKPQLVQESPPEAEEAIEEPAASAPLQDTGTRGPSLFANLKRPTNP